MEKYHEIRREYGDQGLNRQSMLADPMLQFQKWFDEVRRVEDADPTAMVLATVDQQLCPDTRVLLLKELASDGFIFYTNYHSTKGLQIANNQQGAINFYWSKCARQVRARGRRDRRGAGHLRGEVHVLLRHLPREVHRGPALRRGAPGVHRVRSG